MIRRDLGPEAVIVSSRKVSAGGWRGLFQPKKLEVTAAVEYPTVGAQQVAHDLRQEVGDLTRLIKELQLQPSQGEEPGVLLENLNRWQEVLLKLDISHELVGSCWRIWKDCHRATMIPPSRRFSDSVLLVYSRSRN